MKNLAARSRSGTIASRWPAACNKNGVRVTPKSTASTSTAPAQSGTAKSAPVSFLDMLSGASADSASTIGISDSKGQGHSGKNSGGHDSDQSDKSSADAAQSALLSTLTPVVPPPVQANALAAGLSGTTTNLDGAARTASPISLADGPANSAGVLASTTQIAPSLLADSATTPVGSFQNVAAKADTNIPSTGVDSKSQPAAEPQPRSAQASLSTIELSHTAKAGLQQVMSDPLQGQPQTNSQDSKPISTGAATGNQIAAKSATEGATALSSNPAAVDANLSSLPLPAVKGTAQGSTGAVSGINPSLRTWNPQSKISSNGANSDSKAADSKADQASPAATSSGSSHGADNNNQQNQDPQSSAAQASVPAKAADTVPAHLIPAAPISKSGDAVSAGPATQASDSGTHHGTESASVGSAPIDAGASAGAPGINAARVIQSMSGTEMRVGMHSSDFGEISIHTTLSQLQIQTQISVNHSELGSAIATHIPAMQAKLGSEHGIHASIEVSQTGSSLSGNSGQSSAQRNQKAFVPATANINDPAPVDSGYSGLRAPPSAIEESRLDIRA